MHLVRQVLALNRHDPKLRYGALILDPKATLVAPVRRLMADAGRERDLRIINPSILDRAGESVNLIDARMNPAELAKALVLSARAARAVDVSDQFWSLSWGNVFAAALILLRWYDERPVTLCRLLDALSPGREARREIEHIADEAERAADLLPRGSYRELSTAVGDIRRFYHADYVGTVEEIIKAAYGRFQGPGLEMFSVAAKGGPGTRPLYDDIIDNGRVLGRKERVLRGSAGLTNLTRPLLIACDEFGEVATELPAEPVGDGHFFALAREAGCMGILGLQGISTLEKAVRQSWPAITSTTRTIVLPTSDHKTLELIQKVAGRGEWRISTVSVGMGPSGVSVTRNETVQTRENLPTELMTRYLGTGEAWCLGSPHGAGRRDSFFFRVPYDIDWWNGLRS
jgi:hypothetical protein